MLIRADARSIPLRDGCVQCVVTSPPYFRLRDYGMAEQIGQEQTPDAYIAELVAVFREVRRVLRDDGVLFVVLGDCYINKRRQLMPPRVALALQDDGWLVRDEIVWHKPRTTPAPMTDRTVSAHEMVYLLTKRASYYFDYAAIEEPAKYPHVSREAGKAFRALKASSPETARKRPGYRVITVNEMRRKRSVWSISPPAYDGSHFATFPEALVEPCVLAGSRPGDLVLDPFSGSGTVVRVARRLNRRGVGTEINPAYLAMAKRRISDVQVSLLEATA